MAGLGGGTTDSCRALAPSPANLYSAAVERHVKERLVGAAVLIAAAIILIPEMLSGPGRDARSATTNANGTTDGATALKTYTIDLSKSPATQAAAIDNRAPPAETTPTTAEPSPAPQATPESASTTAASVRFGRHL